MEYIAIAGAALGIYERVMPLIRDALAKGEVKAEDQETVRAEYESLRARSNGQFQGDEWDLSGR